MNKSKKQKSNKLTKNLKLGVKAIMIAGAGKGQQGEVIQIVGEKVKLKGVNMTHRFNGGKKRRHLPKGIVEAESLVHMSNIRIISEETK